MAILYRISKSPTIYQQEGEGALQPFTSPEALTGAGYQFGQEKELTPEEFSGLQSRYGIGAPIGSEYVKPIGGTDVYKYTPQGLRKFATPEAATAAGVAPANVGNVAPETIAAYKPGTPITEGEAAIIIPNQLRTTLEEKYGVPKIIEEKKGLTTQLVEGIKKLPTLITGARQKITEAVSPIETKLTDIENTIATRQTEWNKSMEQIRNQQIAMPLITGQLAVQQRAANIDLQSLDAQRSALQGQYDRAYKLASQAADDSITTAEQTINGLKSIIDLKTQEGTEASTKAANDYQIAYDYQKTKLATEKALKDQKIELMLKYPEAGISMLDDINTVLAKVEKSAAADNVLDRKKKQADIDNIYSQIAERAKGSSADQKEQNRKDMAALLDKYKGADRRVSPETWNSLKSGWLQEGGSAKEFDDNFGQYVNKSHVQDYDYRETYSAY
jgi:hypothetical protein